MSALSKAIFPLSLFPSYAWQSKLNVWATKMSLPVQHAFIDSIYSDWQHNFCFLQSTVSKRIAKAYLVKFENYFVIDEASMKNICSPIIQCKNHFLKQHKECFDQSQTHLLLYTSTCFLQSWTYIACLS